MTNLNTQILVQNVETFSTVTTVNSMEAFDAWLETAPYGIVSLDSDADGEYGFVALVASDAGPDYIMDMGTGEMEPVEQIDPQAELAAKMDIMMEMDMNDVAQEDILAMLADEPLAPVPAPVEDIMASDDEPVVIAPVAFTPPSTIREWLGQEKTITPKKPRKPRKAKTLTQSGGSMPTTQPTKIRNFEILTAFISANPGVSRTDVFADAGLQSSLRTPSQVKAIAADDKAEVKRWNRRLNFLIRESKRQGVDIQVERKGRVAHYTVMESTQLELPFTAVAEARNSAIIGNDDGVDVIELLEQRKAKKQDAKRMEEADNQMMDFEALLATLDDEAVAPVTK